MNKTEIAVAALIPLMFLARAYALLLMWGWFVVPATGAAEIGFTLAIGLILTWNLLNWKSYNDHSEQYGVVKSKIINVGVSVVAIAFGYITQLFL